MALPMIGIRVQPPPGLAGQTADHPVAVWFEAGGGDIGRNPDCAIVLSDPDRHISRRHAQVLSRNGAYYLRLLSGGLPVDVDGRVLQIDEEAALEPGARIQIGGYRLEVLGEPDSLGLPPAAKGATPAPAGAGAEIDLVVGDTGGPRPAPDDPAAALLAGLQWARLPAGAPGPEQWQLVGALLRNMTDGLLDLLTARMVAKREFGAQATQLRTRENNPLKFSPDVDTALAHLLGPTERGFMPPLQATREAFDDLRAHQVALLAGMRAALDAVMARFDPAALEQRIARGGAFESLIPSQRKARLWDAYSQQFAQIVGEVEGDFDALLGRAFLKAYQAQLAELQRHDGAPAPR
ncbi:MAG: type VI secretion system-associated FHA domain protein TagH [Burkholderiaceae bacterium]